MQLPSGRNSYEPFFMFNNLIILYPRRSKLKERGIKNFLYTQRFVYRLSWDVLPSGVYLLLSIKKEKGITSRVSQKMTRGDQGDPQIESTFELAMENGL